MSKCISPAQARTKCVSTFWAHPGPRHFPHKFLYQGVLVKCPSSFRLRRLAQNACPRSGLTLGPGIFPANFRLKWLLWHVQVHFACAGSHKMGSGLTLGPGIFHINSCIKGFLWNVQAHFDCAGSQNACPRSGLTLGPGISPVNFHIKWLLRHVQVHFACAGFTKCVSAFLAHSGPRHFPCKFLIEWLLWNAKVHFDCAGSHKVCVRILGSGIFTRIFL